MGVTPMAFSMSVHISQRNGRKEGGGAHLGGSRDGNDRFLQISRGTDSSTESR